MKDYHITDNNSKSLLNNNNKRTKQKHPQNMLPCFGTFRYVVQMIEKTLNDKNCLTER
uniref:Uncharacterized protein n=1 Tax=Octopus bimaculoides TaxID=37653 RepID=A0A0L8HWL9_OCTBM